jgi:hypothetical protein
LLLSVFSRSDFKRETFTDSGTLTIPGKGRDMGKYFRPALSGRDESKAAIIVPFCKRAVYAHKNSSLAPFVTSEADPFNVPRFSFCYAAHENKKVPTTRSPGNYLKQVQAMPWD